jgi:hypothetical protein
MTSSLASDAASSWSDESHESSALPPSPLTLSALRPLRPPPSLGPDGAPSAPNLASEVLLEQFERAQQYAARHAADFTPARAQSLQVQNTHARASPLFSARLLHSQDHFAGPLLLRVQQHCCCCSRRAQELSAQLLHVCYRCWPPSG